MIVTISTEYDLYHSQPPFAQQPPVSFLTYLHLSCSNIIGL